MRKPYGTAPFDEWQMSGASRWYLHSANATDKVVQIYNLPVLITMLHIDQEKMLKNNIFIWQQLNNAYFSLNS